MTKDGDARPDSVALGSGADDPQGSPPEPEDKGDQVERVELEGRAYTKADLLAIIGSRKSLEREVKDARARLKEMEEREMDDKQKAERRAEEAERENAKLKKQLVDAEIQRHLDMKLGPGRISAKYINLNVDALEKVGEAVETFIKENPGLVQAPPGRREDAPPAPGGGPPASAPARVDREAQLLEQINTAQTEEDLKKAKRALDEYRGTRSEGGRRTI